MSKWQTHEIYPFIIFPPFRFNRLKVEVIDLHVVLELMLTNKERAERENE